MRDNRLAGVSNRWDEMAGGGTVSLFFFGFPFGFLLAAGFLAVALCFFFGEGFEFCPALGPDAVLRFFLAMTTLLVAIVNLKTTHSKE